MKDATPPDVTFAEMDVWLDALKRGTGSYSAVARLLKTTPMTLQRWRDDTGRTWPWWQRDVMNACVGVVALRCRAEMSSRRKGSHAWNAANMARRRMMTTLDALPVRTFDFIMPMQTGDIGPIGIAVRFLQDMLDKGPKRVSIIKRRAGHEGIAPITLYRASQKLGVVKKQTGFGAEKDATWELVSTDD